MHEPFHNLQFLIIHADSKSNLKQGYKCLTKMRGMPSKWIHKMLHVTLGLDNKTTMGSVQ